MIISRFTQKDGLTSYNIRKIIQDKWGFIWVATQEGVSRFDGRSFSNYTKNGSNGKQIGGTDVRDLIEDTIQNLIWVLPTEGRVNAINSITGKVVRDIAIPDFGREGYNLSMLKLAGELWIGTSTGVRILNTNSNSFQKNLSLPDNLRSSILFAVRSIQTDENGNIWVGYGGYGIVIYDGISKSILKTVKLSELNDLKQMNEIRIYKSLFSPGQVLFATNQGLRKINYSKSYNIIVDNYPCKALPILNTENIDWIDQDTKNSILISGFNNLYRFDNSLNNYKVITELSKTYETKWLSSVLCLYRDHTGNTWLGCQEGLGFINKNKLPFTPINYSAQSNLKLDHVFAVSPIKNGNILTGMRNGIVEINLKNGEYKLYDSGHLYQHIFQDKKENIHVSRPDGLFIYENGNIIPIGKVYPEFLPYAGFSINSHLYINDTLIIFGTENNSGIMTWNPLKKKIQIVSAETNPLSLSSNIVNNIYKDSQERIWVLSDNVITVLSKDLKTKQEIGLKDNKDSEYGHFFDMCESNGFYWICAYGSGVLQVDKEFNVRSVYNTQNGLSNDGVYQVYSLPGGQLLVTSNKGLSKIDINTFKIERFYIEDGLHSNGFEEVSGTMRNGKIYAGGVNGFTIIDPKNFYTETTSPKLYFTSIETQTVNNKIDTSNLQIDHVTIPNNALQTMVYFSGLNYSNPERIEYAYRILEKSEDWINNGNRNFFQLIGFAPGTYTVELKAANVEGEWGTPIRLSIYFKPKWYQTWWFKMLIAFFLLGVVYQFYKFRIRQFKREENIRKRLASDLHDDLGSTINSVNIYTNLAMMEDGNNNYLKKIKKSTQEAIISMRDIIWILDDKKDTIGQLIERVRQFAYPLCEVNNIAFVLKVSDVKDYVLGKEEKRNLYMMIKEAVNNSIKYAEPATISILINQENGKLMIQVSDDGKGFELTEGKKGNGLSNIERRTSEIGYQCFIRSSKNDGTVITLVKQLKLMKRPLKV